MLHLVESSQPFVVAQVCPLRALLLKGSRICQLQVSASPIQVPKSGYTQLECYIKTKISPWTPWHSGQRMVGTSSCTDYQKGEYMPLKDT